MSTISVAPPCRKPCPHCPWRVGVDAWAIGRDHTMTVPPLHYDEMIHIGRMHAQQSLLMECHLGFSPRYSQQATQDRVCVGYAIQVGMSNVLFRLTLMTGAIHEDLLSDGGVEMHGSFAEMIDANPPRASIPT